MDRGSSHFTAETSSSASLTRNSCTMPLKDLSPSDVQALVAHLKLFDVQSVFKEQSVTGKMLYYCEAADELKELGVSKKIHCRMLMDEIDLWKNNGVPNKILEAKKGGKVCSYR